MKTYLTIAVLTLGLAAQATAAGDSAAGQEKSKTCAACHGPQGNSTNPQFPKLAGQYESYLLHALKSYKNGSRKNGIMNGMVAGLSDQDMEDLAAYFSSQGSELHVLARPNIE